MNQGSSVYKKLNTKASEIKKTFESYNKELLATESSLDSLTTNREEEFKKIAETYLPELADEYISTLKDRQAVVQSILKAKQERRMDLNISIDNAIAEKNKIKKELDATTSELNSLSSSREEIRYTIMNNLKKDGEYQKIVQDVKAMHKLLKINEERLEQISVDCANKISDYESDKLFMGLYKKGFATEKYSGKIKFIDSVIAKAIKYQESVKDYELLKSMPLSVEKLFREREQSMNALMDKGQAIEKKQSEAYGLEGVMKKGAELMNNRNSFIKNIGLKDEEQKKLLQELKDLDNTKDKYYKKAISDLKEFLEGEKIENLKKKVRESINTQDDDALAMIESIDSDIRKLKDNAKTQKSDRDKLSDKMNDLNEIVRKFNNLDYESDRSFFKKEFNIDSLLAEFDSGNIDSNGLWEKITENQYFEAKQAKSISRNSESNNKNDDDYYKPSRGWGGSGGSDSHSGGFGGFGGGSFKTGGGF